ncbi:MAG: acetyl-CoA acetyltransferase [Armatimonadota bacterium]|nr:acetyl-CoA acetyltransferase [Armatimonadota bacterium]MDR7492258.1 acetyl-CoA acetyltransferase [Armatimonadota bacterium]MDR7593198.1 acetyl-CoA acetyltransferase [Armatimonadota bacterium]
MGLADRVAIIGTGTIKFGENFHQSYSDMVYEAATLALADAGVEPGQIQAGWLGTYEPLLYGYEGNAGTFVGDILGLPPIPITRVAAYCASGMEAVRNAALAVASGEYQLVLVVGAEKMREVPSRGSLVAQAVERGHPLLCKGRTAPGMFALLATRYFREYQVDESVLAHVAVKNHYHGSLNPRAHFQKPITPEQHARAPKVAEPLGLFDCCPTTDGAAACVLAPVDWAERRGRPYVRIRGIAFSVAAGYWNTQFDPSWSFTSFRSTREAARAAYRMAGITDPARELDVVECHDCFTITEIINYEDLGLAPPGEGHRLAVEGVTRLGGSLPVNTSGGLKSCGHPVGASGVRMINHIADQLLGRAGAMQVPGARTGLAHTLGGPGAVACVAVLGQP